jgi:hypothetical protein
MKIKRTLDWDLVDRAAEQLGVPYFTRRKWRQRNTVPYKWRLPLMIHTNGILHAALFEANDKRRKNVA